MRSKMTGVGVGCLLSVLVAAGLPAQAAEAPTWMATARAYVIQQAEAHGIDAEELLAQPIALEATLPDGTVRTRTMSVEEALSLPGDPTISSDAGEVPARANAGNLLHAYLNIGTGSALGYKVNESAVAPSTPIVFLPPPLTDKFFHAGGRPKNVKGSYAFGMHSVGTVIGSNVDTSPGSPYVVWLPELTGDFVEDNSIDFVGFAIVEQGQVCLFGLCIAIGLLIGDGVTLFDEDRVAFPAVP